MKKRIVSIGGGNMGRAIVGGLLAQGYQRELLSVVDPDLDARAKIKTELGVTVTAELAHIGNDDIVLLAVKPQIMQAVVNGLADVCAAARPLLISIAAGITTSQLGSWFGAEVPIVRVMPNIPALVGRGAAALFATAEVDSNDREAAQSIMAAVGLAVWVEDENHLDVVTALSGSGPAYFFLIMEILERVAIELGLDSSIARTLAIETAHGAALLAGQADISPGNLREQVTSPGGTTEAALEVLRAGDIEGIFRNALNAAHQRARDLGASSEQ